MASTHKLASMNELQFTKMASVNKQSTHLVRSASIDRGEKHVSRNKQLTKYAVCTQKQTVYSLGNLNPLTHDQQIR